MPVSKAQQRAVSKYMKKNYDEIKVRVKKGYRAEIKAYAESHGESVNGFIIRSVTEVMARETGVEDPFAALRPSAEEPDENE